LLRAEPNPAHVDNNAAHCPHEKWKDVDAWSVKLISQSRATIANRVTRFGLHAARRIEEVRSTQLLHLNPISSLLSMQTTDETFKLPIVEHPAASEPAAPFARPRRRFMSLDSACSRSNTPLLSRAKSASLTRVFNRSTRSTSRRHREQTPRGFRPATKLAVKRQLANESMYPDVCHEVCISLGRGVHRAKGLLSNKRLQFAVSGFAVCTA
jgi:hypothetical protein